METEKIWADMRIRKTFFVYLLSFTLSFLSISFSFQDSDLDGVEDSKDKCPNTPFYYLVDKYGCPVKKISFKKEIRYYLRFGFSHSKDDGYEVNLISTSFSLYYRPFYFSVRGRYYTYVNGLGRGLGDTTLYFSYRKFIKNLGIFPGFRIKVPTASEKFGKRYFSYTPSVFLDYFMGKLDIFFYVDRTFRATSGRKDTWLFSAGAGYSFSKDLYVSLSTDIVESSVRNVYSNYLNFYTLYYITKRIFITANFSKGINDYAIDRSISLRLGLRF